MLRLLLITISSLLIFQCSRNPTSDKVHLKEQPEHIFALDEIPPHIQDVENLSIFPADSEPECSIELISEQVYGKTGEPYLTEVHGSVVDDQGRVIILNSKANYEHSLYVYNPDGTYHNQIGGRGRGPGEYGFVFDVQAKAGKVFIRDVTNQRLTIFNTDDYSFDRSMLLEQLEIRDHEAVQGMRVGLIMARKDGNHLVSFSQQESDTLKYLLMDTDGNVLNFEPLVFPSSLSINASTKTMTPSLRLGQMMGQTLTALSSEDALYSIWTEDFLIKKYDENGIYQSAIYYPVHGVPFDLDEYAKSAPFGYNARDIEKGLESMDKELPENNPVLGNLMVDDENRIWAAVPMNEQREILEWWILNEKGELIAKLRRPSDLKIFDIKDGYLYAKEIDEKTDAEYVVKYRIKLTEREIFGD